jgi:4a-hydroxytetrahydrobiopterin dehydratase
MDMLTTQAILDAGLDDWRKLAQALHARYLTGSFADGLQFVGVLGEACAELDHQPEVRLAETFVDLKLISDDAVYRAEDGTERQLSWVTQRDIDLARRISSLAQELGVRAEPGAVTQFELALDTADLAAVGPFWAAVLTGSTEPRQGDDVVDPTGRVPNLWFQGTDPHETPRQRFHVDLWVPPEVAEERIAAGIAAGGRVTYDKEAPSFTVLADPEGNKVCICTCLDR